MRSTSLHRITADKGNLFYKLFVRTLYYPLNIFNNRKPLASVNSDLKICLFKPDGVEDKFQITDDLSSPSRKLSDLFWMSLNWKKIQEELGEINICDLGCGTGKYFYKLQDYSGKRINKYYGFDIDEKKEWSTNKDETVKCFKYDGKNILDLIPEDTNLIISQSAMEHFQEDITVFKQLAEFNERTDHKVVHIHIFPSKIGLKLFGFHGVRQYTPRTISKITKLFTGNIHKELILLGGKYSSAVHMTYIRKKDIRKEKQTEYIEACRDAMIKDFNDTVRPEDANFYALRIG